MKNNTNILYILLRVLLLVQLLVVIDSTVYEFFQSVFANFGDSIMIDYIKIFFGHVVNGV